MTFVAECQLLFQLQLCYSWNPKWHVSCLKRFSAHTGSRCINTTYTSIILYHCFILLRMIPINSIRSFSMCLFFLGMLAVAPRQWSGRHCSRVIMPPSFQIRQWKDWGFTDVHTCYHTAPCTTCFFESPPCQSRHLLAGGGAACAAAVDSGMGVL